MDDWFKTESVIGMGQNMQMASGALQGPLCLGEAFNCIWLISAPQFFQPQI